MADFCSQCSVDSFGEDFGDLAGQCTKEENEQGMYALVICEGCGVIQVDYKGICISPHCLEKHNG